MKSHLTNHTGEKPFDCVNCGKKYSKTFRLKIHLRTHVIYIYLIFKTGNKPFRCPFKNCNKFFNEKGNLKTHIRIHTGEKPFSCSFENCHQTFKAHGHLGDHVKRHFNIR